jgi:hypothetical protein
MTTPYPFVAGQVLTAAQLNDIQNLPISDKVASYVLTVADAYKRTMMNAAGATTITVNNSIFTVGDVIQVANKGAGTCTITAGAGVTINTSGSLALAQYGGGYLLCLSASTFTFFNLGGIGYGAATGGSSSSITVGGVAYTLLDFTSDGTLTVTKSGLFDVLMVGGGGCGGYSLNATYPGSGGGGGQVLQTTIYITANQTVTIGTGGNGLNNGTSANNQGTASRIGSLAIAVAGGSGSGVNTNSTGAGAGGNGGGGNGNNFAGFNAIGVSIAGGFNGGAGSTSAGGGGGSAANGSAGSGATGGAGGAGTQLSTFTGSTITTFVGAGGGGSGTTTGGAAGSTGAGAGGSGTTGASATANTGSGGGGSITGAGGNGGSGRVLVRFKS